MATDPEPEGTAQSANPDPVADSSLSGPLLVFSALLFLSLVWALWDELAASRPWKRYQQRFTSLYTAHLKRLAPKQVTAEKGVRAAAEYQRIAQQLKAAEDKAAPRVISARSAFSRASTDFSSLNRCSI